MLLLCQWCESQGELTDPSVPQFFKHDVWCFMWKAFVGVSIEKLIFKLKPFCLWVVCPVLFESGLVVMPTLSEVDHFSGDGGRGESLPG